MYQTDPPAETLVEAGESIKLTFNPAAEPVAIENVAGLSLADATAKLQAQGFVVTSIAEPTRQRRPGQRHPHRTGRRASRPSRARP